MTNLFMLFLYARTFLTFYVAACFCALSLRVWSGISTLSICTVRM